MSRRLITRQFPFPPASNGYLAVVPNINAALSFSGPVKTLRSLADEVLRKNGINVADYLQTQFALIRAITAVCGAKNASSLAVKYRPDLSAALRTGVNLVELEKHGSERVKTFARVARKYTEILGKQKAIDPEAVLTNARSCCASEKRKILVYGFFRGRPILSRPEEYEFIDAIADEESIFFLPAGEGYLFEENQKWIDELVRRGWEIDNSAIGISESPTAGSRLAAAFISKQKDDFQESELAAYSFPSIEEEVRGVLAMAKGEILAGTEADKIAIVCRKPEIYANLMRQTAEDFGIPIQFDLHIPLAATQAGNFVRLLIEANLGEEETGGGHRFAFDVTLRLLFHSVLPSPDFDVWITARRNYPEGQEKWTGIYPDFEKLVLETADRTPGEFAAAVAAKIESLGIRERLCYSAEELIAFEQIIRLLHSYGRQSRTDAISFKRFAAEIASLLSEVTTDFCVSRGGVRLMQPNSAIGSFFDVIFAIGLAEGMHPIQPVETLTIDYLERKRLAENKIYFEAASEIARWEDLTFCYTLFSAKRKVVCSFPLAINEKEQIPSVYFEKLNKNPVPAEIPLIASQSDLLRHLFSAGIKSDVQHPLYQTARHALEVERRRNSECAYDEYDGVLGIKVDIARRRWSATRLTEYGQCPFKWFARNALKLKPVDEAVLEIDALSRGSFYHRVLEIAGRKSINAQNFRQAMLDNLSEAFAEAENSEDLSITKLPQWELLRNEIFKTLENAIISDDFIAQNTKVIDVEKEFECRIADLKIHGRVDRIDKGPEGISVIDYKAGSRISRICFERELLDIQIPLYLDAIKNMFPNDSICGGSYYSIKEGKKKSPAKPADLKKFINGVKEQFQKGRFPVRPCKKTDVCKYCDFDTVCRQGDRLELKPKND